MRLNDIHVGFGDRNSFSLSAHSFPALWVRILGFGFRAERQFPDNGRSEFLRRTTSCAKMYHEKLFFRMHNERLNSS